MTRADLPYESATSGQRALGEIERILQRFGCQSFGSIQDFEAQKILIQFKHRGVAVHLEASMAGYAAAWLKAHPWSSRMRRSKVEHEREAARIAGVAVYSVLRDWIKGQITAVECGILTFEGAFLGQILLGNGSTVLEHVKRILPSNASPP